MLTTSNWRAPHKRIGFVLDADDLAAGLPVWEFEGHKVYCLSESMRCLFDTAEILKRKLEVQRNVDFYTQSPDEMFVVGTIGALGSRLKGVVTIETGKALGPACRVELEHFTQVNNIPVISCTAEEFSAMRCAPGGFKVSSRSAPVEFIRTVEEVETA